MAFIPIFIQDIVNTANQGPCDVQVNGVSLFVTDQTVPMNVGQSIKNLYEVNNLLSYTVGPWNILR
jgi:hypothetical protein